MRPELGGTTVAIIRSSVVLPALFGPSRQKTPGPVCKVTPATAWARPNRLVTSLISTFMTSFLEYGGSAIGRVGLFEVDAAWAGHAAQQREASR